MRAKFQPPHEAVVKFRTAIQNLGGRVEVAKRIKVTRACVYNLERGKSLPDLKTAFKIERQLGISMASWLPISMRNAFPEVLKKKKRKR